MAIWSWKLWSPIKTWNDNNNHLDMSFATQKPPLAASQMALIRQLSFAAKTRSQIVWDRDLGVSVGGNLAVNMQIANLCFICKLPICNSGSLGTCQCRVPSLRRQPPRASDISSLPSPWMFCICCRPSPIEMHIFICFVIFLSHLAENVDFPFFQGGAR